MNGHDSDRVSSLQEPRRHTAGIVPRALAGRINGHDSTLPGDAGSLIRHPARRIRARQPIRTGAPAAHPRQGPEAL